MNQELEELEGVLGTDFRTLDEQLEETSLADIPEKLISISRRLHGEHNRIEENNRTLSELALFDRKASLLSRHIAYVNRIRDKLQSGYQHLVNVESQLLNGGKEGLLNGQTGKEAPSEKMPSKSESKRSNSDQKSLKSTGKEDSLTKVASKEGSSEKILSKSESKRNGSEQKNGTKRNDLDQKSLKSASQDKKQAELLSNLIDLEQKEFVIYLNKILGADISQLDWKRFLCLYCAVKGPLKSESIKILKAILTKDFKRELDAFVTLLKLIEQRNRAKFVSLKSLLAKIRTNSLDESRYPTVNSLISRPARLFIFVSGGISFNELNLVKTNPNTTLISDCILYPKKVFLNSLT